MSLYLCLDLNNKLCITDFPLKFANIKKLWLSKGSNPREVAPIIFSLFYIFKTEFLILSRILSNKKIL